MRADGECASVRFLPAGTRAEVAPGSTVLAAAAAAGMVLPAPCGGRGACGRCAVKVIEGALEPPEDRELSALARARADASLVRLACMARVAPGEVTVRPLAAAAAVATAGEVGSAPRLVAGVDLGTTSVAAQLIDASRRTLIGSVRIPNRQASFGGDVLSRISAALGGEHEHLMAAAEDSILDALSKAGAGPSVAASTLERIVVAGNTAMTSLLLGADVSGLASHPFSHALDGLDRITDTGLAARLGGVEIRMVPPVTAFVGGDLVAGVIAAGLADDSADALLIDLGTNAEVAAVTGGKVVVASAPAGPAFEGWGIACGGQAGPGGIVRIAPGGSIVGLRAITDEGPPSHLTGSGLISAIAYLRRAGHLDADGLLRPEGPCSERFFTAGGVLAVSLGTDPLDRRVFLSQLDVRALQSAKAAVCVAVKAVVRAAGANSVRDAVVTGAFGGALETGDLVELGIVPTEAGGALRYLPEAALQGAAAMALEPGLFEDAQAFVSRAEHLDLAVGESFTSEFVAALRLEAFSL
ncbi:MAG: ASKHA domain-containing protein [Anaerosomatales bacterium]|nr:ASKHA domain-containing protein [Anaerosomatales bacterium]